MKGTVSQFGRRTGVSLEPEHEDVVLADGVKLPANVAPQRRGYSTSLLPLTTLALSACGGSGEPAMPAGTPAVPAVPEGLTATAGNGQVALAWSASPGATGYSIGRSATAAGPYTSIGTSTTTAFTDSSVSSGTSYYYVISASNAAGSSVQSAAVVGMSIAPAASLTRVQAARFLAQAAFGGSDADIQNLQNQANGIQGWLTQQFAMPVNPAGQLSNVAWMQANNLISVEFDTTGVQSSLWRKLISSPDVLRQRLMLALTDLFVVNTGATQLTYRGAAAAYYLDQLEANAFGNFQALLLAVSHTPAMGQYLTYLDSVKANPVNGDQPR